MTDQQFYQENLIKCLESIRAEILDEPKEDYGMLENLGVFNANRVLGIVDKYLDKAKQIKEIKNGFN